MAGNITRDDLFEELCKAVVGDMLPIQEGDVPLKEVSARTGVRMDTLYKRVARGDIPAGWEVVDRRGENGLSMKCFRKVSGNSG
jgi:hypothetical protein